MDEDMPSGLYRRTVRDGTLLQPLLDRAAPMSQSSWTAKSYTANPEYQRWYKQPNEEYWPKRGGIHKALSNRREMEAVRSDFVRDGCSPEPTGRRGMKDMSAQTSSATLGMSFLDWFGRGDATVSYPNAHGGVQCVHGISKGLVEDRSFLLSQAFEGNRLHLEAVTGDTIRPLLQYIYTGAYSLPTPSGEAFEDVPTSLLIHCQMYHLADIYDIGGLKRFANVAIIRQCEFGCSSPDQPIDLCPAIGYVYNNMREHEGVIETIVAYCVACFLPHALSDDFEFRELAFDLRPFHQDLCKVSMERRFDNDDIAQAIIQMPFRPYVPATYASREDCRATHLFDDVYHVHGNDGGSTMEKRSVSEHSAVEGTTGNIALALRPKSRKMRKYDFAGQDEETIDADDETAMKPGDPWSSSRYTTEPTKEQQRRREDLHISFTFGSKMKDGTMSLADENNFARMNPALYPGKGKRPLRVVNYTTAERNEVMETGPDLRPEKHVTLDNLVERTTSSTKPATKEPEVKVSRQLFNNLVSAGLTGKPGPFQQTTQYTSLEYLKARGSSQEVRKMCAELAKEELEKARLESEHKAKSKRITHDRQVQPPPSHMAAHTAEQTELWKIPPPTLNEQEAAAMPESKRAQVMAGLRKADQEVRAKLRLKTQSQQSLAGEEKAVLDAGFEVIPAPGPVADLSSESESDSDLVKVEHSPSMLAQDIPSYRSGNPDIRKEEAGSDIGQASDSDWDMI